MIELYSKEEKEKLPQWKKRLHEIIFEADTWEGKLFDIALLILILFSFFIGVLDSIKLIQTKYHAWLLFSEWLITILFTLEYIARLIAVRKPIRYTFSFFGIVDLLSILPTYLSFFFSGTQFLMAIRLLRLVRVFRILKLANYIRETETLVSALKASFHKILVFLTFVLSFTAINGTIMYIIEGEENGYTSIPTSMYWAIVTLTTVGYGDIAPKTAFGQFISSLIMLSGYAILAVPTGIVSSELTHIKKNIFTTQVCPACSKEGHDQDAVFCKFCGDELNPN